MSKYIERLVKEWDMHGKIVIAVDYDSTLSPYHTIDNADDINKVKKVLIECINVGCYIFIHTSCNKDRYDDIRSYCKKENIMIDSINENPIDLPYGNEGKPYANIYLDDRAGLMEALDILQEAMYRIRAKNSSKRLDYPGAGG